MLSLLSFHSFIKSLTKTSYYRTNSPVLSDILFTKNNNPYSLIGDYVGFISKKIFIGNNSGYHMIGVRTESSEKKVCTGLVATTRFRCRIVVTRNECSKRKERQ